MILHLGTLNKLKQNVTNLTNLRKLLLFKILITSIFNNYNKIHRSFSLNLTEITITEGTDTKRGRGLQSI